MLDRILGNYDAIEREVENDYSVFEEEIWPVLAKRIPSFESLKVFYLKFSKEMYFIFWNFFS